MTEQVIQTVKDDVKACFKQLFGEETEKKIEESGYYEAPASTKYHLAIPGGLLIHSYNVMSNLCFLTDRLELKWQKNYSPILVGLLHDFCKVDQYLKVDDHYVYNNSALPGHGDKSIMLLERLSISLTDEERACIRWHMGSFDIKDNWHRYTDAIHAYNNVLYTHVADMMASQIDES